MVPLLAIFTFHFFINGKREIRWKKRVQLQRSGVIGSDAIEWAEPVTVIATAITIASPTKVKTQGLALSAQAVRSSSAALEKRKEAERNGEMERTTKEGERKPE